MGSKEDLSVAYSPGVAEPCLSIQAAPARAYDYTAKGHLVGEGGAREREALLDGSVVVVVYVFRASPPRCLCFP
jgi:malic enzyme